MRFGLLVGGLAIAAALASANAAGLLSANTARGLRNNNPGNLRDTRDTWVGEVGADEGGYLIFDTPEHGLRAMAITLHNYQAIHSITTLRELVERYAPASDDNPTPAYVAFLSTRLGLGADEPVAIDAYLPVLMDAMIEFENGSNPYSVVAVERAARAATFG